jgi:5-methylcytosine-specific restriction endonuclease McrA
MRQAKAMSALPSKRRPPPPEWWDLRRKVFAHYGKQCMACATTEGKMHVDHIVPVRDRPDLELDFDNLQILCWRCNTRKGHRNENDYRQAVSLCQP